MPELPEVETTIKGLYPLIGLKVYKVNIHTKKIRYIVPKGITKIQEKSRITNISRISKYILINFTNNFFMDSSTGTQGYIFYFKQAVFCKFINNRVKYGSL